MFIFDTDSESASKKFNDDYFDYIYIDGEHSFKAVYDDLTYWFPKLKKMEKSLEMIFIGEKRIIHLV